jgi:UDP-glucose-4-epimerase GalE
MMWRATQTPKDDYMRVLVTGGAGYVGSHTVRKLAESGHDIVIYDNLSSGHSYSVRNFQCVFADLADAPALTHALEGVDAVVHFADLSIVEDSLRDPRRYFDANVRGGLELLNLIVEKQIRYFVFSSSAAVYGVPAVIPIPESVAPQPISPYGTCKLTMELALESYSKAYGLRYVSLRYFNAAGADEGGAIGESHHPETHLIPRVLEAAASPERRVSIYGTDYPTPDGTCIRDYIHVNDLADAHVAALEHLFRNGDSAVLNLGTGTGHSVLEVVTMAEQVCGCTLGKSLYPRRLGDPPILVADPRKAQDLLGWQARRSLQQIVETSWSWTRAKTLLAKF